MLAEGGSGGEEKAAGDGAGGGVQGSGAGAGAGRVSENEVAGKDFSKLEEEEMEVQNEVRHGRRERSDSFLNELEDAEYRAKQLRLQQKVAGVTGLVEAGLQAGSTSTEWMQSSSLAMGLKADVDSSVYRPVLRTELSAKTLDIVTNLEHTQMHVSRKLGDGLFPKPVVDMSMEEQAEELKLLEEERRRELEKLEQLKVNTSLADHQALRRKKRASITLPLMGKGSLKDSFSPLSQSSSSSSSSKMFETAPYSSPSPASVNSAVSSSPKTPVSAYDEPGSYVRKKRDSSSSDIVPEVLPTQSSGSSSRTLVALSGTENTTPSNQRQDEHLPSGAQQGGGRKNAVTMLRIKASSSIRSVRNIMRKRTESPERLPNNRRSNSGGNDSVGDSNATVSSEEDFGQKTAPQIDLETFDHHVKVLLLGDSGVGKTSLMCRFADNEFQPNMMSTAGVDFKIRYLHDEVKTKGKRIKCQIWDTAGQERFHVITRTYYRGSHGIALVYDVTNEQSFNQINYWMNNIKNHAGSDVIVVLFGNKIDLPDRKISYEQGNKAAEQYNALFYETSAKDGTNVLAAFQNLSMNAIAKMEASKTLKVGLEANAEERRNVRSPRRRLDAPRKQVCKIM